ncbi:hypothetical protein ABBQ32_006073 [Trebouxia sp. C0010 RCD-2024]
MEDMVPELEDLEERGYFKKQEIKQIVKKRTHFEYLLKRPAAVKMDFLRYAEYETKLESLRAHRKEVLGLQGKTTLADYSIVKRTHLIYERATRKFRGDLRVWLKWLHFCKSSGSTRQISRVLTKALQLHPAASGLWSYAAAWEFEHNSNAAAARTLMQRGLRMCKGSRQLWLEYFRMELMYAHKLRKRRHILGLDALPGVTAAPQADLDSLSDAQAATEEQTEAQSGEDAINAVLTGAIAKVVYKTGIEAVPDSIDFRQSFLEILSQFKFEGIESLQQSILDSIQRDFGDTEEAWDLKARAASSDQASTSEAVGVYEDALAAVPTARMFSMYATYLQDRLSQSSPPQPGKLSKGQAALVQQQLQLCKRAYQAGLAEEALLLRWPELAVQAGDEEGALEGAAAACQAMPTSSAAWQQRLALHAQHATVQACETSDDSGEAAMAKAARQLERLAVQAVAACEPAEAQPVWLLAFEKLTGLGSSSKKLTQALLHQLTGMRQGPTRGGMGLVAGAALQVTRQMQSLEAAQRLCDQMLAIPSPGGSFFQAAISMELAAMPSTPQSISRVQRLFEAGVAAHGCVDHELWLQYASFEQKHLKGARNVYWRAVKALAQPDDFVAMYSGRGT